MNPDEADARLMAESPPPSDGPVPLIFDDENDADNSPSMASDEMRQSPSPMMTPNDAKMY